MTSRITAGSEAGLPRLTEKQFQAQVVKLARLCNWLVYHTHDSRRSPHGFPDLVLVHPGWRQTVFAELKVPPNKATVQQKAWLLALREAAQRAYLWTPEDWPEIERILKGGR